MGYYIGKIEIDFIFLYIISVLRYDLGEDFSIETAVVFCETYRNGNDWKFNAVGAGYQGGLVSLVTSYGLSV